MVQKPLVRGRPPPDPSKGVRVVTSPVPIKPPEFAVTKSVNYLQNAMVGGGREEEGVHRGYTRGRLCSNSRRRRRRGSRREPRWRTPLVSE